MRLSTTKIPLSMKGQTAVNFFLSTEVNRPFLCFDSWNLLNTEEVEELYIADVEASDPVSGVLLVKSKHLFADRIKRVETIVTGQLRWQESFDLSSRKCLKSEDYRLEGLEPKVVRRGWDSREDLLFKWNHFDFQIVIESIKKIRNVPF